jgi:carboxypeptidase PM20D1
MTDAPTRRFGKTKLVLALLVLLVVILGTLLVTRTYSLASRQVTAEPAQTITVDHEALAGRFARALTFPTVSPQDPAQRDTVAFLAFHEFLTEAYPGVHRVLTRETVGELSLLFTWQGREANLTPVILMGHMDVVPVIPGTEEDWTYPPFVGAIADGYIWGRGALDNKSSVIAILEAVERLVADGFQPRRTIYLAFGHDEEVGGPQGAGAIADLLAERGVAEYAMVLDEGGVVAPGDMVGVPGRDVALVGIAEKGFVSMELHVEAAGGHSSTPPPQTAIGILAKAISRLEENPFPATLDGPGLQMFEYLAPEMGFVPRMAFANLWLTRPLVKRQLLSDPASAAMLRTTTAATIFNAGVKDNVLPIDAHAVVNHRIRPGETVESVAQRVREIIDDPRVHVTVPEFSQNPSRVSDPESGAYRLLDRTIRETVPVEDLIVIPYLLTGGTDAKYYAARSTNVLRFLAVVMEAGDLERVHGTNERVRVESLASAVQFFHQLILNAEEL